MIKLLVCLALLSSCTRQVILDPDAGIGDGITEPDAGPGDGGTDDGGTGDGGPLPDGP